MNTSPASVHFRANEEFSLSYKALNVCHIWNDDQATYEAIAGMYTCTALLLSSLDDLITI